jgi:hypothetical protein
MHASLKWLVFGPAALTLALSSASANAVADAGAGDDRVAELEQALRARDRVITELLDRVQALEERVGMDRRIAATDTPSRPSLAATAADGADDSREAAPGRVVVDEDAIGRALERSLTLQGALLLPSGVLDVEPVFTYGRQEAAYATLVPFNGGTFAGDRRRTVDELTLGMSLRLGLPWDAQLEVQVPYRWRTVHTVTELGPAPIDASSRSGAGWGDLRLGFAKTLLREGRWRPDLVGRLTWDSDTGETTDGLPLGDGFHQLQASLTAIKRQDPIAFVTGLSYEYAFAEDQLRPGPSLAGNIGGFIALSPQTSLQISLAGGYQWETRFAGEPIGGTDRAFASLILGGSTLVGRGTLINTSALIGLTNDTDDLRLVFSMPVRPGGRLF